MTASRIVPEGVADALEFFATCPKGFEPLLADELASLGARHVRALRGQVGFGSALGNGWGRVVAIVIAIGIRHLERGEALRAHHSSFLTAQVGNRHLILTTAFRAIALHTLQ